MGNALALGGGAFSFEKSVAKLDAIVSGIMANSDGYVASHERCVADYNVVLGSELKKHLKVELAELKDVVYFVPDAPATHTKKKMLTKQQLCEQLTGHYGKALQALQLLKTVYDTERGGEGSLYARIAANLKTDKTGRKLEEVRFCAAGLDVEHDLATSIAGLREFVDGLGTPERNAFLHQLHALASKGAPVAAGTLACGDALFSGADYRRMYGAEHFKGTHSSVPEDAPQCRAYKELSHLSRLDTTAAFDAASGPTPFLNKATCARTRTLVVAALPNAKDRATLARLYRAMTTRASANLRQVREMADELVTGSAAAGGYKLKHLTHKKLDAVTERVKRAVASYYVGTLHDYSTLLRAAHAATEKK